MYAALEVKRYQTIRRKRNRKRVVITRVVAYIKDIDGERLELYERREIENDE